MTSTFTSLPSVDTRTTTSSSGDEWRTAMRTTRRIRTLVNDVVSILREEQSGGASYRMTTAELLASAEEKVRPLAAARPVAVETVGPQGEGQGQLLTIAA